MKKMIIMMVVGVIGLMVYAAEVAPTNWVADYTYSLGSVSITNTTFTTNGAAVADLDGTTGDIREISKALLEEIYDSQEALAATNRPAYMNVQKQLGINSRGELTTKYTITFVSDISGSSIASE